jgi:hypothetical protein
MMTANPGTLPHLMSMDDHLNIPPIIVDENRFSDQRNKTHNSIKLSSYAGHRVQCNDARETSMMKYQNIINYPRVVSPRNSNAPEHCVMCGQHDIPIPAQNKSICKPCDSSYWLVRKHDIVVKFCKGRSIALASNIACFLLYGISRMQEFLDFE